MANLDIDTEVLRGIVTIAEQTNVAITEASNLLNQVVIHNDWACIERYQINEYTMANRQTIQKLQDNSASFYRAIKQSSACFDEEEQKNISRTNQVEGILSQIYDIVPGITGGIEGTEVAISAFDDIKSSLEG